MKDYRNENGPSPELRAIEERAVTTDLSSKTVAELREITLWQSAERRDVFDELARRLEEAQQKIVAQQERVDELVILAHELGQLLERALEEAEKLCDEEADARPKPEVNGIVRHAIVLWEAHLDRQEKYKEER